MSDRDSVKSHLEDMASDYAPWNQSARWWVVLIEGLIAVAIAAYLLLADSAPAEVASFAGLLLLVFGLADAFAGLTGKVVPGRVPLHMLGAGLAIGVGGVALSDVLSNYVTDDGSIAIAALGLMAYGVIGLVVWVMGGASGDRSLGDLIVPVGSVLIGGASFFADPETRLQIFNTIYILIGIVGIGLAIWSFILRNKQEEMAAKAGAISAAAATPKDLD